MVAFELEPYNPEVNGSSVSIGIIQLSMPDCQSGSRAVRSAPVTCRCPCRTGREAMLVANVEVLRRDASKPVRGVGSGRDAPARSPQACLDSSRLAFAGRLGAVQG